MERVELGERYVDTHTGFAGTATARTEYVSGWASILIEARTPTGDPKERWVHEPRLAPFEGEPPGTYV